MKVRELAKKLGAKVLSGEENLEMEISCGYSCDLLSWVLAHGKQGMGWCTVQSHVNVIAVAALLDFACVIIPESLPVEAPIIAKAKDEDIILLSSDRTAYELVMLLAENGVAPAKKG